MKTQVLTLIAGFSGSILLASTANAEFIGLSSELDFSGSSTDLVGHLYANFSSPTDRLTAVAGTQANPMSIMTWGTFYQHEFGFDTAPNPALIAAFPSLAEDTFVTIGKLTSTGDQTGLTPQWPGFTASSLNGTNLGWFVTPDQDQGLPVDGRVLMAQFGVIDGSDPNVAGEFLIQVQEDGAAQLYSTSFAFLIPAPGTLSLIVGVGLVGRRRRRQTA